jgi:hypothetical protein
LVARSPTSMPTSTTRRKPRRNPRFAGELSPLSPRPSDLISTVKIRTLKPNRYVDLHRSDLFRSDGLGGWSTRNGTGKSGAATCHIQASPNLKFDLNSLKTSESCRNYRKRSTTRFLMNNIALETLGHVEFISTIYFQSFQIKFESKFRLN